MYFLCTFIEKISQKYYTEINGLHDGFAFSQRKEVLPPMAAQTKKTKDTDRIVIDLNPIRKQAIEKAASLENKSVKSFILDLVQPYAQEVIEQHSNMSLSNDLFDEMVQALDHPRQPRASMVQAGRSFFQTDINDL